MSPLGKSNWTRDPIGEKGSIANDVISMMIFLQKRDSWGFCVFSCRDLKPCERSQSRLEVDFSMIVSTGDELKLCCNFWDRLLGLFDGRRTQSTGFYVSMFSRKQPV